MISCIWNLSISWYLKYGWSLSEKHIFLSSPRLDKRKIGKSTLGFTHFLRVHLDRFEVDRAPLVLQSLVNARILPLNILGQFDHVFLRMATTLLRPINLQDRCITAWIQPTRNSLTILTLGRERLNNLTNWNMEGLYITMVYSNPLGAIHYVSSSGLLGLSDLKFVEVNALLLQF